MPYIRSILNKVSKNEFMKIPLLLGVLLLPSLLPAQPGARPSAQSEARPPLFTLMNDRQTGIYFLNKIVEDDSLNVMRYEYLYNGAGVGIAHFNNDALNDIFFSANTRPYQFYLTK